MPIPDRLAISPIFMAVMGCRLAVRVTFYSLEYTTKSRGNPTQWATSDVPPLEKKMNPGDFILLLLSLAFAAVNLFAHGWTLNGVGAAVLSTAGAFWQLWMQ